MIHGITGVWTSWTLACDGPDITYFANQWRICLFRGRLRRVFFLANDTKVVCASCSTLSVLFSLAGLGP